MEGEEETNPYNMFIHQESGNFYSIMHDGIQKFGMELNGVILRFATPELDVVNIPWKLTEIPGGSLNANKLINHLFNIIFSVQQVRYPDIEPADKELSRCFLQIYEALDFPQPPIYFKVCRVLDFDNDLKFINLEMICSPVLLTADGCKTNTKAGKDMVKMYGLVCPSVRCSVHAADGSLKRMANSKTRSVEPVVEFLGCFRKVTKHFQLSIKCSIGCATYEESVHMVTFCPTRMAYLLTACAQAVLLLLPHCR